MANYDFYLTPGYCLYNGAAVKKQSGSEISFAIENPEDEILRRRLERAFVNHIEYVRKGSNYPENFNKDINIRFEKSTRGELKKYISGLYGIKNSGALRVAEKQPEFTSQGEKRTKNSPDNKDNNAAAVLLLDSILDVAKSREATDIHIENNEIKFRVKGRLERHLILQENRCKELVQRIKLIGGMNVIENRKSQDGHFIYGKENGIFVRVSTVPVVKESYEDGKESVVLRLLDTSRIPLSLNNLGFNEAQLVKIAGLMGEKNGLIVICGPTGAGKSTTAASMLMELNRKANNTLKIISLEDPPEYVIPGVTQIQVDDGRKNSFDEILNHIFRQDPDVIMIGEIRDSKSGMAALRASLTGHLVIATLHTSSAAEALLRLENLGLERKLINSVLKGVIVQEIEYMNCENVLLADVAVPVYGFCEKAHDSISGAELENLFIHEVNGGEVLRKTVEIMREKNRVEQLEDENIQEEEEFRMHRRRPHPVFNSESGVAADYSQEVSG